MCHLMQHFGASLPLEKSIKDQLCNIMHMHLALSVTGLLDIFNTSYNLYKKRGVQSVTLKSWGTRLLVLIYGATSYCTECFTEELLVSSHDLNEFWLPALVHPSGFHLPGATGLHTARFRTPDRHSLFSNRSTQLLVSVHLLLHVGVKGRVDNRLVTMTSDHIPGAQF